MSRSISYFFIKLFRPTAGYDRYPKSPSLCFELHLIMSCFVLDYTASCSVVFLLSIDLLPEHVVIGVASCGALGHVPPPRLPASYFGDHSLYRL